MLIVSPLHINGLRQALAHTAQCWIRKADSTRAASATSITRDAEEVGHSGRGTFFQPSLLANLPNGRCVVKDILPAQGSTGKYGHVELRSLIAPSTSRSLRIARMAGTEGERGSEQES
ncbi:hypothetical protein PC9H_009175 [Pleurotus ostreatus]|uniref:Uncharacterized protein n=1 Tax=Pleurotus ostreatus TaxID=5322 RepID=A0A8H6ZUJ1_PLEOS|nr:uncharacterized protein PC9H_009175 [Pleurotus ostreatus]KAF7426806.1 hypothetical protein PC9H_009175 [Pleurotus ostreatus]